MNFFKMRLKLSAMETRRYWRLRRNGQRLGARLNSARISSASRAANLATLIRIGGRALSKSAALIAPPLIALIVTQSIAQAPKYHFTNPDNAPDWISKCLAWLVSPAPNALDSAEIPTAAIGVVGIFVAVYFATVSFVVSTTYKDATRKLRDQIVRQPESSWYATFFTQAVVYVALALALPVVDRSATSLTLVIASTSAVLVVLSFGQIWATLFLLLEPTSLIPQLQRDLNRWVHRAYKIGAQKTPSPVAIQRARTHIRSDLETFNDLVTLVLDREYERSGDRGISSSFDPRVGATLRKLLMSWESYSQRKHVIRSLSGWNPKRSASKDWFLTDNSEVSIALATGTNLTNNQVLDELWFERQISQLSERLLAERDLRSLASVLHSIPPFSRALGSRGQFEELRLWLKSTTFAAMAVVGDYTSERDEISITRFVGQPIGPLPSRAQHLALPSESSAHNVVDHILLEVLSASLGYIDYFRRMHQMLPSLGALVADDSTRIIAGRRPIEIVANLRTAIATEIRIEGGRVTPNNALTQLVARELATEAIDEVENFIAFMEDDLWPWLIEIGRKQSWAAGAALSRATELTEKVETLLHYERELLDACESAHIEKDDRWPSSNMSVVSRRAASLKDALELPVARLAAAVDSAPDTERPDYFGWAYYRAHENVLARMLLQAPGEPTDLHQKVSLLYLAGDVATQRMSTTVRRHDQIVINSYVSEPYLRFLQLCGIALTMSEVAEEPKLFAPFESLWSSLFTSPDQTSMLLGRAAATLSSDAALYALTPGGMDRSNIEIRANQALDDLGVPNSRNDLDPFGNHDFPQPSNLRDNTTRILRSIRSSNYEKMFYARWLRPHALAAGGAAPTEAEQYLRLVDIDNGSDDD